MYSSTFFIIRFYDFSSSPLKPALNSSTFLVLTLLMLIIKSINSLSAAILSSSSFLHFSQKFMQFFIISKNCFHPYDSPLKFVVMLYFIFFSQQIFSFYTMLSFSSNSYLFLNKITCFPPKTAFLKKSSCTIKLFLFSLCRLNFIIVFQYYLFIIRCKYFFFSPASS